MLVLRREHINAYWRLMRADKPIGTYLLLWPTIWAVLLASFQKQGHGFPALDIVVIFVLGVFLMRSAGCVINDYADRHVDGAVERTASRPLAQQEISEKEALQLFALLILLSFVLVLMLNWQTMALSIVALALATIYPFMKRYTYFPQVFLGAAFSWSIPMAVMATLAHLPTWVWWLYMANLMWTVAYDTQYAMVDREDDRKIGIKSIAIFFGAYDLRAIALLQSLFLLIMGLIYYHFALAWPAYVGLIAALILCAKQWKATVNRDKQACFHAFLNNHIVGMCVAAGLAIATMVNWA